MTNPALASVPLDDETANSIPGELAPAASGRRRELTGYVSQFRAQLAYWHAVMQRADR